MEDQTQAGDTNAVQQETVIGTDVHTQQESEPTQDAAAPESSHAEPAPTVVEPAPVEGSEQAAPVESVSASASSDVAVTESVTSPTAHFCASVVITLEDKIHNAIIGMDGWLEHASKVSALRELKNSISTMTEEAKTEISKFMYFIF